MQRCFAAFTLSLMVGHFVQADDWPQWLGPQRDSVWRETGIVDQFPQGGFPVQWRVPVALGYSGPAVAGGYVYVMDFSHKTGEVVNNSGSRHELEGVERVMCLNAGSGELEWKHEYRRSYNLSYPAGPRATPTVHGGKVYALGAEGDLSCLDARRGQVLWSKQLKQEYQTEAPFWGFCGHPLVDGNRLVCLVGGEGSIAVAFDKDTGQELWRSLSGRDAGYCPPTLIEVEGQKQLVIWHSESINGLEPETGRVLWTQPLEPSYRMSITAPRTSGPYLFASGIGNVGALFRLSASGTRADVQWRGDSTTAVYCANSTPFIEDGVIYGVSCQGGQLRAIELKTGRRLWQTFAPTTGKRRASHGTAFLVKHADRFLLFNENGDLILARLSPQGYDELGRFHVLEPTGEAFGRPVVWSHPAFANRCIYARNDKQLVCVSLAKR